MKLTKTIMTIIFSAVISISVTAKSDTTEYEIEATMTDLVNALNDKDIQELRMIYTEDAVVIPAETPVLEDTHAILSFWQNKLSAGKSRYRIDVIDFRVRNNIAHLSALWSATVISPGTRAEVRDGYLTNVMERQDDGRWKIHIQTWN